MGSHPQDLTDSEAGEIGPLIKQVSQALQQVLGCVKTYVAQFAEHPLHPHVHVHVIPRAADQAEDQRGPRVFSQLGIPAELCVSDKRMNDIAADMRNQFIAPSSAARSARTMSLTTIG